MLSNLAELLSNPYRDWRHLAKSRGGEHHPPSEKTITSLSKWPTSVAPTHAYFEERSYGLADCLCQSPYLLLPLMFVASDSMIPLSMRCSQPRLAAPAIARASLDAGIFYHTLWA